MKRIRFAVAGSGWRAMFYVRAAKALPDRFELTGVLCHSAEKAEVFAREQGVLAFSDLDALLATRPEFVVSCVSKVTMTEMVMELLRRGVPVMSETPFGTSVKALLELHETWQKTGTPLAVAEQYFLYPSHAARRAVLDLGLLGTVHSCALSMMHDYHGMSMLRFYLGEESAPVTIHASRMDTPIVMTGGRGGLRTDGAMGTETRYVAQVDFGGGRMGLYDFSGIQYHSFIRTNHLRILGERGEMFDDSIAYVGEGNLPALCKLETRRDEKTGNPASISLDGVPLWHNPFETGTRMSEDDIAVCRALLGMGMRVEAGREFYPVKWGMRDAYHACLMMESAETGRTITAERMPWDN